MKATNITNNPIAIKMVELAAELTEIEDNIIPYLTDELKRLTATDYDPYKNPDDQYREDDIEYLTSELAENKKRAIEIRHKMEQLSMRKIEAPAND